MELRKPDSSSEGFCASKRKFNSSKTQRTCRLSFDELLERFLDPENSFATIGSEAGLTGERIRQIYKRFFQPFIEVPPFSTRPGLDREQLAAKQRRERKARDTMFPAFLAPVLKEAEKHKIDCKAVLNSHGVVMETRILLNGFLCSVHRIKIPVSARPNGHRYFRMNVRSTKGLDFLLAVAGKDGSERFFILPRKVLDNVPLRKKGRIIYIPEEKALNRTGPQPAIDTLSFENKWSLISQKAKPAP